MGEATYKDMDGPLNHHLILPYLGRHTWERPPWYFLTYKLIINQMARYIVAVLRLYIFDRYCQSKNNHTLMKLRYDFFYCGIECKLALRLHRYNDSTSKLHVLTCSCGPSKANNPLVSLCAYRLVVVPAVNFDVLSASETAFLSHGMISKADKTAWELVQASKKV